MITTPQVFIGKYAITRSFNEGGSKIQQYIDYYEPYYMNNLLGAALYVLFQEGIDAEEEKYVVLLNAFAYDSQSLREPVVSEGIAEMLKCLIYAHYLREDLGVATSNGKVILKPEGGENASDNFDSSFAIYNEGIRTYQAIQRFIYDHREDYPEFKGTEKQTSWYI